MSMRIKRYGDWIEYVAESGKTFYYNDKDGSFQWEHPYGAEHTRAGKRKDNNNNTNAAKHSHHTTATINSDHAENSNSIHKHNTNYNITDNKDSLATTDNPHYPWKAYIDPESGSVFWYNEVTFVSQWEMPAEFEAEVQAEMVSFYTRALNIFEIFTFSADLNTKS